MADGENDLTLRTMRVLYRLDDGPRRLGELASTAGVTAPAITLSVAALERHGWVRRSPDPSDRRATLVSLTDAGREALRGAEERLEKVLDHVTSEFDATTLQALKALEEPLHTGIDRVRTLLGSDPEGLPRPR